ncbi:MAG: nicotinamide mononucleotide transporter [Floccifex sp.]
MNTIKNLSKTEWILWILYIFVVTTSNMIIGNIDSLIIVTTWIGATALILAAKGNVWSQIMTIVFSIFYAIISYRFHYWGEMITYLGMTLPMAIWSAITWIQNPSENGKEVKIQKLDLKHIIWLLISGALVTILL